MKTKCGKSDSISTEVSTINYFGKRQQNSDELVKTSRTVHVKKPCAFLFSPQRSNAVGLTCSVLVC